MKEDKKIASVSSHREKEWEEPLQFCGLFKRISIFAEVYNISNGSNVKISNISENCI